MALEVKKKSIRIRLVGAPLMLGVIAVASHLQWFNFPSLLNFSDWYYWPNKPVQQLFESWGIWVNFWDLGSTNIQIYFFAFKSVWSAISYAGFSYDVATKVTFFIPIALLGFISPYICFRKLLRADFISFIVALFYGTTTHFLVRQTGHLPIALLYALFPLTFRLFLESLERNDIYKWIQFILLYWLMSIYEVRIVYIFSMVLLLYFLWFHAFEIGKYAKNILFSGFVFIALNVFWIFPTIFGGLIAEVTAVTNRGLFGSNLFSLNQAFVLFESSWTGGYPNMSFIPQSIPFYLLFVPYLILITFVARLMSDKDRGQKQMVLFFSTIALIGILLTKQSGQPFAFLYEWLYTHFPGFNLFREASKFYVLTAFGYAGLLGYGLLFIRDRLAGKGRMVFYGVCGMVILLSAWNLKPLMTGEIRTLFVPRNIPVDYRVLESELSSRSDYFRTLWVPEQSRWSYYDNIHPKIGVISAISSFWKDFVYDERQTKLLPAQESVSRMFGLPSSNQLMDVSSIRYVFVPLQDVANDDDFFVYYGGEKDSNIRQWYIDRLDSVNWLKRIDIGTEDLAVYENENYRPHIYLTEGEETIREDVPFRELPFEFVNPTEYRVRLENISKPVWVNFSEKYHADWKTHIGKFRWWEVLWDGSYFLSDSDHMENDAKLNSFLIDPREVCGENACRKNPDGSVDMNLTIYFRPQSYFYLGLIISGMALTGSLGYLGRYGVRKLLLSRKKKEG